MSLNTTQELIKEIQDGHMIILMDDVDRENEGDLVIAASCISSEDINFMARYGRGLICLTLTDEHCKKLNLPLIILNPTAGDGLAINRWNIFQQKLNQKQIKYKY